MKNGLLKGSSTTVDTRSLPLNVPREELVVALVAVIFLPFTIINSVPQGQKKIQPRKARTTAEERNSTL
eukprot:2393320-Amphidinium_carterae.1